MKEPSTIRDALFAQAFLELDLLIKRVETLPKLIVDAQNALTKTTEILNISANTFRAEMNQVGVAAKKDIIGGLVEMQEKLVVKTTDEQVRLMHEAARSAFNSEAFNKVESLTRALTNAMYESRKSDESANLDKLNKLDKSVRNDSVIQIAISMGGSIITSAIVYFLLRTH